MIQTYFRLTFLSEPQAGQWALELHSLPETKAADVNVLGASFLKSEKRELRLFILVGAARPYHLGVTVGQISYHVTGALVNATISSSSTDRSQTIPLYDHGIGT